MATTFKPKATEAVKTEPQRMNLQLAVATRLMEVNGALFENHKAYSFGMEEAQDRLATLDPESGLPVWKVYRPKTAPREQSTAEYPQIVDADSLKPEPDVGGQGTEVVGKGTEKTRVIEIGTDAELAELGLDKADDSDNTTI